METFANEFIEVVRGAVRDHPNKRVLSEETSCSQGLLSEFAQGKRTVGTVHFLNLCWALDIPIPRGVDSEIPRVEGMNEEQKRVAALAGRRQWVNVIRLACDQMEDLSKGPLKRADTEVVPMRASAGMKRSLSLNDSGHRK